MTVAGTCMHNGQGTRQVEGSLDTYRGDAGRQQGNG